MKLIKTSLVSVAALLISASTYAISPETFSITAQDKTLGSNIQIQYKADPSHTHPSIAESTEIHAGDKIEVARMDNVGGNKLKVLLSVVSQDAPVVTATCAFDIYIDADVGGNEYLVTPIKIGNTPYICRTNNGGTNLIIEGK